MNATFDTILCFTCAGPTFALRATWSSLRLCLVALRRTTKRPHNRFRESNVELNLKGPEQVRAKVTEQKIYFANLQHPLSIDRVVLQGGLGLWSPRMRVWKWKWPKSPAAQGLTM